MSRKFDEFSSSNQNQWTEAEKLEVETKIAEAESYGLQVIAAHMDSHTRKIDVITIKPGEDPIHAMLDDIASKIESDPREAATQFYSLVQELGRGSGEESPKSDIDEIIKHILKGMANPEKCAKCEKTACPAHPDHKAVDPFDSLADTLGVHGLGKSSWKNPIDDPKKRRDN